MPTPEQVLSGLSAIANEWRVVAILWHAFLALMIVGLLAGVRPSRRLAGILLALPLISVALLAWATGNPFNGLVFTLASICLIVISVAMRALPIAVGPAWLAVLGALLFVFGWFYPHFLAVSSWVAYLYSAPTGLIPCPTLSIVIGLALILNGLSSRWWSLVIGIVGLFYGVLGVLRLGVTLDVGLIVGALVIVCYSIAGIRGRGAATTGA